MFFQQGRWLATTWWLNLLLWLSFATTLRWATAKKGTKIWLRYALGPLLVNVVPTPLHQILELLPLLLASLRKPVRSEKKNVEGCSKVTDVNATKQVLQNLGKSTSKSVLAVFFVSYFCQPMVSWWFGLFNRVAPISKNPFHKGILGITKHRDPNHQGTISWFYRHRCCFLWKKVHETLRQATQGQLDPAPLAELWVVRLMNGWKQQISDV